VTESKRRAGLLALLPKVEGRPIAMVHLARQLLADGDALGAVDLCRRAGAFAPGDPEVATLAADVLSTNVPSWHFHLLRDDDRNSAYDAALRRAIHPGSRVLEIGTGTGLLAMMAARAGAAEVITCEADPVVAALATEIVAANGFADRVRVIAKHSTDLDAETDLGGPVDLLVSEIFSNDAVSEGALPAIEDAWARLLTPDARVIPARALVVVALATDALGDARQAGVVDGFDLSAFNVLARPAYQLPVESKRLTLSSKSAMVFTFDFEMARRFAPTASSVSLIAEAGGPNGVAQWLVLEMDAETSYAVRPGEGVPSCWAVMFHPIEALGKVAPGDEVAVSARHDRHSLHLWAWPKEHPSV
jgi:predicted O-methyltransferase YrrM